MVKICGSCDNQVLKCAECKTTLFTEDLLFCLTKEDGNHAHYCNDCMVETDVQERVAYRSGKK